MLLTLALAFSGLDPLLETYAETATGSFSSEAQHRAAPDAYDWVEARVVRLPDRGDGALWLYQEQAIVTQDGLTPEEARARPYFQRVSRIVPLGEARLRRDNFRIENAARFVGIAAGDPRLADLAKADLSAPGCHNVISYVGGGSFTAETPGCDNDYKGAVRMESRSVSTPDLHVNWDRGFAADGSLVWGPPAGGYVFERTD